MDHNRVIHLVRLSLSSWDASLSLIKLGDRRREIEAMRRGWENKHFLKFTMFLDDLRYVK